jgi:MoxR-like ATPase
MALPEERDQAQSLRQALRTASGGLVEREVLVELIGLAAVAGEHLLVIGPPGTAKSQAVRRVAQVLGGRYFEYLLGRFTEPNEIFGPVDLRKLQTGIVEIETAGMLPEAEVAFLDEVFLGSTAILNTLLQLLNERSFRRGSTQMAVPLRVCVGASNALPEVSELAAFADRFLVRVFVDPLEDARLEELIGSEAPALPTGVSRLGALDELSQAARQVDLGGVRDSYAQAVRLLRRRGIALSDRRIVRAQRLVAAAAALAGRTAATRADLWPLVAAVPRRDEQSVAREALAPLLAESESQTLGAAAAELSLGPLARAARIVADGESLLDAITDDEAWRLRLEGVAREIDATFPADRLPEEIAALRRRIVERLGP